jgi:hypothetical protein
MAASRPMPSRLAERTLLRDSPKIGAVCGKAARTDLCGGRRATGVPTATTSGGAGYPVE